MTKTELVEAMAQGADITKVAAGKAIDTLIQSIATALAKGEDVSIMGFGTFTTTERSERTGRNPQTGEQITIAASKAPKFKPGSILKDAVSPKA
jgi:DNA-binding protein HU-beta